MEGKKGQITSIPKVILLIMKETIPIFMKFIYFHFDDAITFLFSAGLAKA